MRGTPIPFIEAIYEIRITPAHAGNTNTSPAAKAVIGDHPRTCGEHPSHGAADCVIQGSPPHMRGTPISIAIAYGLYGITPAHAGNTFSMF